MKWEELIKSGAIVLGVFLMGWFLTDLDLSLSNRCETIKDFKSIQVFINKRKLILKKAETECELSQGLMGQSLSEVGEGMLFKFPKPEKWSFWMKNTKVPLSIAFIDENMKIVSIQNMTVENDTFFYKQYEPPVSILYAIETPLNWFLENNIKEGDLVVIK